MRRNTRWLLLSRGGEIPIEWLFRDEFITAESAPATSPRTPEPDATLPGVTLVQNDGQISVADGNAVLPAQATPAWADQGLYFNSTIARQAGLAFIHRIAFGASVDIVLLGSSNAANLSADTTQSVQIAIYGLEPFDNGLTQRTRVFPVANQTELLISVFRAAGAYHILNEQLVAVSHTGTSTPLRPKLMNYSNSRALDYIRAALLPVPFADDSLALQRNASPAIGNTFDAGSDALHYIQWTPESSGTLEIRYRYEDDDNCMILRGLQADSRLRIIKRAGGSETQLAEIAQTFTASTQYRIALLYYNNQHRAWVVNGSNAISIANAYNSEVSASKITAGTTIANWEVYPAFLPSSVMEMLKPYISPFTTGSGRTPQTIYVADGGDIAAAIATMLPGDTLSLAHNGSYTLAGGASGFTGLPSGVWGYPTRVEGNGATITGGNVSLTFAGKRHIVVSDLVLTNAVLRAVFLDSSRWITLRNITASSNVGASFLDVFRFTKCRDVAVINCVAGPSTGWGEHDGFEFTDQCRDCVCRGCTAHGVIHGFEVWTGTAATGNWKNANITWESCNSYDNAVGYSAEGGPQNLAHVETVARNCTASSNSEYDYQGVDGATLYIEQGTGGTTNGSVVIRS